MRLSRCCCLRNFFFQAASSSVVASLKVYTLFVVLLLCVCSKLRLFFKLSRFCLALFCASRTNPIPAPILYFTNRNSKRLLHRLWSICLGSRRKMMIHVKRPVIKGVKTKARLIMPCAPESVTPSIQGSVPNNGTS